jgi:very-short-patch-repair endonuclease
MLTGVLRHRPRTELLVRERAAHSSEEALTQLLRARSLRSYHFANQCEIGPFVVDHVCAEHALIVDLTRPATQAQARAKFLESLGYRIVTVSRRELYHRPDAILLKLRRLLQGG